MLTRLFLLLCLTSLAFCSGILSSFEQCLTQVGSISIKRIPTSRSTRTVQQPDATIRITVNPTAQVTPAVVNETSTMTTTVYTQSSAKASVVTSTITFLSVTTTHQIRTSTFTVTSTLLSTATSTIPTPSGFLPVADTTASAYPGIFHYGNSTITSVSSASKSSSSGSATTTSARRGRIFNKIQERSKPQSFPQVVNCIESIIMQATQTRTHTGNTVTQTLQASTQTSLVTATNIFTLPSRPGRVQTVYTTTTVVSTLTLQPVAYSTTTVTAEGTTTVKAYAACATNNMLGPTLADGSGITGVGNFQSNHVIAEATSAQDCCAQCMEFGGCTASSYQGVQGIGKTFGVCLLYHNSGNTCSVQSESSQYYTSRKGFGSSFGIVVGNGPCGYLYQQRSS